jgi:hypothetical protein
MLNTSSEKTIAKLLYLGVPGVSLLVTGFMSYDPVNVGKMVAAVGIGFSVLALVIKSGLKEIWRYQRAVSVALLFFVLFGFISILTSAAPIAQNIFGVFGRNTGFLTYLGLAGILLGASLLRNMSNFEKLTKGLLFAGLVNVFVCALELAGYNLFGFNNIYKNILGTFGNPNFISSFLGIFIAALLAYVSAPGISLWMRLVAPFVIGLAFFEIVDSNSIQGVVVTVLGFAVVGYFLVRAHLKSLVYQVVYVALALAGAGVSVAGALQVGPLTQYIYKTSVSLRGEYWSAGIKMGLDHPLTGIGFDTYGDWYRRARSESAMVLPGPTVVTNSAHNVNIDIFSYGGFPLIIAYLTLIVLAAVAIFRVTNRTSGYDKYFYPLATAWICYQAQAMISINQIGLAVWGWALTGAVIGYERATRVDLNESKTQPSPLNGKSNSSNSPTTTYLISVIGLAVGIIFAFPAFLADSTWRSAMRSGSAESVLAAANTWPEDSYRLANISILFEQNKLPDQAYDVALKLTDFNPQYFDGWKIIAGLTKSTTVEKTDATSKLRSLDPLNTELK